MKRYPSGLITADPITLTESGGYLASSIDQLQYKSSGAWFTPPFPTYTNLSYSNSFDGTGDYLTTATTPAFANLWLGNVTVECWVYFNSVSSTPHIWSFSESSSIRVTLYVASSVFKLYTTVSTGSDIITSATTLTTGRWYHVAITRNSGTWTMWLDGVSQGTSTSTNRPYGVNEMLAIGTQNYSPGAGDYLNGYISNLRAIKDQAVYTGNFSVPTSPLAITQSSSSNVASLISTIPANGNSVYFDGTGDYLTVPSNAALQFGTGDFTIEGWIYQTAFSGDTPITASYQTWATSVNFYFATRAGSPNVLIFRAGDSVPITLVGNTSVPINTWTHVAVARNSGVTKIFVNGTEQTATHTGSVNISATALATGIGASQSGLEPFTGYISNLRFIKGTALYTATFTPPTAPLTAITNTSLLTCQSSTIIDNSSSPLTITVNGDTKVALTDSPFGVSNVKLLTAQSPTVIDNSLNNFTTTVNGDTKALALSPFDTTLQTAYLAVAGGGGGGGQGGGGGAGGLLYRTNLILVPNVTYTITIGAGGTTSSGSSFGSDSKITTGGYAANITAIGGGAGQSRDISMPGGVGGSGGGGGAGASGGNATGQAGTPGQGNSGAPGGFPSGGGGGGGAGGAGNGGSPYAGNGGIGVYLTISGSNVAYAGGGGGGGVGGYNSGGGAGGIGGGGGGSNGLAGGGGFPGGTLSTTAAPGTYGPGAINTGGGGGGAAYLGGSGIVILASNTYAASNVTGNPNVTYDYGNSVAIYRFWQSGTIRW